MVKLLKLVTGEEIIGDITETGVDLSVKNPIKIALAKEGLAMIPFCPFMKGHTITVTKVNVVFETEIDDDLANAYKEKFGGIMLATGLELGK